MPLLLPPQEEVLARKFCAMIHEISLVKDENIVVLSINNYFNKLQSEGEISQIEAIKTQMQFCNPILSKKLNF